MLAGGLYNRRILLHEYGHHVNHKKTAVTLGYEGHASLTPAPLAFSEGFTIFFSTTTSAIIDGMAPDP